MKVLLAIFLILTSFGCFKTNESADRHEKKNLLSSDSGKENDSLFVSVLKYDSSYSYLFPTSVASVDIAPVEIEVCETLLADYVKEYNLAAVEKYKEVTKEGPKANVDEKDFIIELQRYGRQYLPVITEQGDKIVYVNCFCDPRRFNNWRRNLIVVQDGGHCFFNFKVNLSKRKIVSFSVNGDA
jgi:hypothetical protein